MNGHEKGFSLNETEVYDEFHKEYLYWRQYIEGLEHCNSDELFNYVKSSYVDKEVIYRLFDDFNISYKRNYSVQRLYMHFAREIAMYITLDNIFKVANK
ncbi:hypothetical protein PMSD_04995 [Paenibacillus macquariensis subsp. defensor]|nr:hypothetical protein PMSD_04995 [Paenibacillus macquariensis subsp. defensor]